MNKFLAILLMLLINHTLIQSVMAATHLASEHQNSLETPHFHLETADFDHQQIDNDQYQQKHHQNAHIHFHYDLNQVSDFTTPLAQPLEQQVACIHSAYVGLSYRPAVPPPTL